MSSGIHTNFTPEKWMQGLLYVSLLGCVGVYMVVWLLFTKAYLAVTSPEVVLSLWTDANETSQFGGDAALCSCDTSPKPEICEKYKTFQPVWETLDNFACVTLPRSQAVVEDLNQAFIATTVHVRTQCRESIHSPGRDWNHARPISLAAGSGQPWRSAISRTLLSGNLSRQEPLR